VDQETLVSASLTSEMREAGENLLQELDRRKFPAKAAFWLYSTERDDWRLVIATPQRRALGSLKSYKSLQQVISKMDTPIRLRFVRLLDTKDSLIKSLSTVVGRSASFGNATVSQRNPRALYRGCVHLSHGRVEAVISRVR
jgi:hypothetical protein